MSVPYLAVSAVTLPGVSKINPNKKTAIVVVLRFIVIFPFILFFLFGGTVAVYYIYDIGALVLCRGQDVHVTLRDTRRGPGA